MTGVEYGGLDDGDDVEHANAGPRSPFPPEWGVPPAGAYSEERAAWARRKVREHLAGTSMRQLRMRQLQMLVHLRQRLYEGEQDG